MPPEGFDRERGLAELLRGIGIPRLEQALAAAAGGPVRVLDAAGTVLLGAAPSSEEAVRVPLRLDLETAGFLETAGAAAAPLAALLELMLLSAARYCMAADLHEEAVHEDFAALQRKHEELQASEARYRTLASDLEQRVAAQVRIIETTQRQLYQAERLASVGQLAAGVAHEINNPIGFVRSNLGSARGYVRKVAELKPAVDAGDAAQIGAAWRRLDLDFALGDLGGLLDESIVGVDRVARIVADLKGFSNVDRPEEEIVDLNESLKAACNILRTRLPAGATIELDLQPLPKVLCLPGHLNQAFLNVLDNAAQAIASGSGKITVRSNADDEVHVVIADNGCGIAAENLSRVFDPFYTTREVGRGIGLGLTLARDIVTVHNGRIEIDSRLGVGTAVTIHLPV